MKGYYMKKLLCLLLVGLVLAGLTSCGNNDQVDEKKSKPSEEGMEIMFEMASNYERNAQFTEAYEIYMELCDYGFHDPDFGDSRSLDEVRKTREERYVCESIACVVYMAGIEYFKNEHSDYSDLTILDIDMRPCDFDPDCVTISLDYQFKDKSGNDIHPISPEKEYVALSEKHKEAVYNALKDWMDSRGATSENSASYLAGNNQIYLDTQKQAIIGGTATFGEFE